MSYLDWKVGDRVVFIGGGRMRFHRPGLIRHIPYIGNYILHHRLTDGEVYVIEALTTDFDIIAKEPFVAIFVKGFRFIEEKNVGFPASWFRKVQPRKTDISIFKKLLHDAPDEVTA